jgi:probable F420-dependent oxidoreductase
MVLTSVHCEIQEDDVKLGLSTYCTDYSIGPAELAAAAEERGFESLWFPDHTHVPVDLVSNHPDGEMPKAYYHGLDPIVSMAAAAAATTRLRVGTSVCLLIERDTIITAKEIASIDHLSGGRVEFGIGAGWNREEMANHGTVFETRFTKMREQVEALRAIWTTEEAEYHGTIVDFARIYSWPKPVQQPLPILVGGTAPKTLDRVVRYGDGWIPPLNWFTDLSLLTERLAELERKCADAGRPALPVTLMGVRGRAELLRELAEAGVERAVISLPAAPAEEILPRLDHYGPLLGHAAG